MGRNNAAEADHVSLNYRTACDLLQARQYTRVADILQRARVASEQRDDQTTAQVLAIARRLCLACSQCRIEAQWYREAHVDADRQERALRHRLHGVLDLLGETEATHTDEAPPIDLLGDLEHLRGSVPTPPGRPPLWQRVRTFLYHHLGLGNAQPQELGPETDPHAPKRSRDLATSYAGVDFPEEAGPLRPVLSEGEQIDVGDSERGPEPRRTGESKRPPDRSITPTTESVPPPSLADLDQKEQDRPTFVVFCLGAFRIYHNDRPIMDWSSLKARSIFKYLVTHRETAVLKDVLMDLFWPEADPRSARRNLHQAIYVLRQTLRQGESDFRHVQFQNDCYLLNPELNVWLDSKEFEKHVEAGRRFEAQGRTEEAIAEYGAAEALYEGDFMEEDLYEDWPAARRTRLRAMYLDASDRLSAFYVQHGQYMTAMALCHRTLTRDPCCEASHRRLIECYLAQGQRHLAARQYDRCVQALADELGLSPSEETETLYRRIGGGA